MRLSLKTNCCSVFVDVLYFYKRFKTLTLLRCFPIDAVTHLYFFKTQNVLSHMCTAVKMWSDLIYSIRIGNKYLISVAWRSRLDFTWHKNGGRRKYKCLFIFHTSFIKHIATNLVSICQHDLLLFIWIHIAALCIFCLGDHEGSYFI